MFELADRAMASMYFDVNRSLAWGLYGQDDRWRVPLNWEVAIFNGIVTGGAETGSSGTLDDALLPPLASLSVFPMLLRSRVTSQHGSLCAADNRVWPHDIVSIRNWPNSETAKVLPLLRVVPANRFAEHC